MPSEEEEIKRRKEERRRRNKELRTFRSFKKYSVKRFKSLCKLWLNDSCPKTAEECDLVHAEAVVKKPQLCRLYFCSKCLLAKACIFMHETYPCMQHALGVCSKLRCKLSHAPLNDDSRPFIKQV